MTLYRACYIRDGLPRGISFAAETNEEADDFVRFIEAVCRVDVLTLKAIRNLQLQLELT